ncbi:MAG: sporulation protein YqfD [Candidatus Onthomonas sp.]
MQQLVNFLRGTVTLRVQGPFLERYFNICAAAGLGFWKSRQISPEELEVTLARWDLKRALALGEKALCQVEVVEETGLPALFHRLRRRWGMAAGLLLLAGVFLILSRFVLVIQVEGNTTVSDSVILAQLQRHGFGVGSYGPGVDVRSLSNSVLLDMEELSFLTVNITGIRAQVIVRESQPAPEILDRSRAADIVAARDGVIVDVDVTGGQGVVEKGQAVLEGEVLISGMLVNERGDGSGAVTSVKQVTARGEVWAMTRRTLKATTPLQALHPGTEETQTGWGLTLLGRRLNFYGNSSNLDTGCDKMVILYPITMPDGTELPFGLWKVTWSPWETASVNAESAERYLRKCLSQRLEALLGDGQVMSSRWQVERTAEAVTVTVEAQCLEQIGRTVYLE